MTHTVREGKRTIFVAGLSSLAFGCADTSKDPIANATLLLNESRVLGFENVTDWSSTASTLSSSALHTQGSSSVATASLYYTEVKSVPIGPLGAVGSDVSFDFFLPTGVGSGSVKLILESSAAQIYYVTIGTRQFSSMISGRFNTVTFPLTSELRTKLGGNYTDLTIRIVIQGSMASSNAYLLDALRFGTPTSGTGGAGGGGSGGTSSGGTSSGGTSSGGAAGTGGTEDLVETNILSRWSVHSSDPATNTLSVLGPGDARVGSAALRANTTSGGDFWLRYTSPSLLDVGSNDALRLYLRALNTTPVGWQENGPIVVLRDTSGATATYRPSSQIVPTDGATWVEVRVPLHGGPGWVVSGAVNLSSLGSIELHADTWDSGFRFDVDGVRFGRFIDLCSTPPPSMTASATSRATTATLSYGAVAGALGYDIYRAVGSGAFVFVNRARGTTFEDSKLQPGTTYRYRVRPVLAGGCEATGGAEASTTTLGSAAGLTRVPTLYVLLPIYRGGATPYTDAEIARMKAGVELARQFYFRNTAARLNLALDYMEINAEAPSTAGATIYNIDMDLRARGIFPEQYDAVFPIANNLSGCFGGFVLLGRSAGAYGTVCGVAYPSNDANTNLTLTWSFTHEFQHALDGVIAEGSGQDMISGHPDSVYQDAPYGGVVVDAGEHFDWERATLRAFTAYGTLPPPFDGYIEVTDSDADGLANSDARLPMDEQRFGSRSDLVDTDGDGLYDRAEYSAGIFASSNPTVMDTDADGARDGVDPSPRAAIAASIAAATPNVDGVLDAGYTRFRRGFDFSNVPGFDATTYLAYDANYLYVFAEMNQTASLVLQVDGSGTNGLWHGDDSYSFSLTPNQPQPLEHTSRHGLTDPGAAPANGLLVTRSSGGLTYLEARIPSANLGQGFGFTGGTTTGFPTTPGTVLGIRLWFERFGGVGDPFVEPYAAQNEYWHFDDVILR